MTNNKFKFNDDFDEVVDKFEQFLKESSNKESYVSEVVDNYTKEEHENILRFKAREEHKKETDITGSKEDYRPGNIEPLLSPSFNMSNSEKSIARSITATKKSLDRSIESKVDEVNRLLSGIGGFSSQLKNCFAKSTVLYFEKEDPNNSYRERLVFSVHIPSRELKGMIEAPSEIEKIESIWGDAVNGLAKIVESSGLKAKYCKNDKNYGQYVMKQDLVSGQETPDEYYSIVLDYMTDEKLSDSSSAYNNVINSYNKKIAKLEKKVSSYSIDSDSPKYSLLKRKLSITQQEKEFFVATVPDPGQVDEGLLLHIDISSLKDYHIVRNKMQSVMTKFILHLSKVDPKMELYDPDIEYEELNKTKKNEELQSKNDNKTEIVKDVNNNEVYIVSKKHLKKKAA